MGLKSSRYECGCGAWLRNAENVVYVICISKAIPYPFLEIDSEALMPSVVNVN